MHATERKETVIAVSQWQIGYKESFILVPTEIVWELILKMIGNLYNFGYIFLYKVETKRVKTPKNSLKWTEVKSIVIFKSSNFLIWHQAKVKKRTKTEYVIVIGIWLVYFCPDALLIIPY